MNKPLHLSLFGSPQITYQGQPLTGFVSGKVRALLIYLAATNRPQSRDHLAHLLWEDTLASMKVNLRKAISNLRQLLGDILVEDGKESISLDAQQVWVDVVEFGRLIKNGSDPEAAELYQSDFLHGFNLSLSYEFEVWALSEQSRLKSQMVELLRRLATQHEARNTVSQAILTVRRLLALEPWHEENHRWLMELLAKDGQRSAALAHFEVCKRVLKEELDVVPSSETIALLERIQRTSETTRQPRPKPTSTPKPEFPLIGREKELQVIQQAWQTCLQQGAHFVSIAGEAGIGKTRLTEEARIWVEAQGYATVYARSYAAEGALAYSPVVDWLRSEPIRSSLDQLDTVWLNELVRLLPELLKIHPQLSPPQPINDSVQRRLFFEALVRAILVTKQPLLLVIDDLQWCDQETMEWLRFLQRFDRTYSLLMIGAYRLEEVDREHSIQALLQALRREDLVTEIELGMLNAGDTVALINAVSPNQPSAQAITELWKTTTGHPLFVIESIRSQGAETAKFTLPRKVQNVIQAKLAQLSPAAAQIVELAAAIGCQFSLELLTVASQQSFQQVSSILPELWQRKVFISLTQGLLDFSHDRIREVAYSQIPPFHIPIYHQQIAHAYISIYSDELDAFHGQIAHHFSLAGKYSDALRHFHCAGKVAMRLNAYSTAIHELTQALSLFEKCPDRNKLVEIEIDTLDNLGEAYKALEGYQSYGSERCYLQLEKLARQSGKTSVLIDALGGLRSVYQNRAQFHQAFACAEEMLTLARQINVKSQLGNAHNLYAASQFHVGNLLQAWQHFEEALRYEHPHVFIRSIHTAWLLGYPDKARDRIAKGIQLKRQQGDANDIVWSLSMARNLDFMAHDFVAMQSFLAEFTEMTTKYNLAYFLRINYLFEGWELAEKGYLDQAMICFDKGLRHLEEAEAWQFYSDRCGMVAESLGRTGQYEKAVTMVEQALAFVEKSGERFWQAELLRQKGQFLISGYGNTTDGELLYQQSLEFARQQGAKSLELRTSVSLARLWQTQGKQSEAYQLLASIYNWFSEGFATVDLLDAKRLLDELKTTIG